MLSLYREGWRIRFSRAVSVVFPLTTPTIPTFVSVNLRVFDLRVTFHPTHLPSTSSYFLPCTIYIFFVSSPLRMLAIFVSSRIWSSFQSSPFKFLTPELTSWTSTVLLLLLDPPLIQYAKSQFSLLLNVAHKKLKRSVSVLAVSSVAAVKN
jgi:hypothetical protein